MKKKYDAIEYYNNNAKMYFEQTVDVDMGIVYDKFLSLIPDCCYILDFGCGCGRDSKYFLEHGYKVKAIDGSIEMCKLASNYIGQDVSCLRFDELKDENIYDAIWACSSILHVSKEELPYILKLMIRALKKNGIMYITFKKGENHEIKDGKYYSFFTREEFEKILDKLEYNIEIIDCFDNWSFDKKRNDLLWINFILWLKY